MHDTYGARRIHAVAVAMMAGMALFAASHKVSSPDGTITATISDDTGTLTLAVERDGATLLEPSPIGMEVKGLKPAKAGKMKVSRNVKEVFNSPFYRQKQFTETWNEGVVNLSNGVSLSVRAFDSGVAYRFSVSAKGDSLTVADETADFRFPADVTAWLPFSTNDNDPMAMAYQNFYEVAPLSSSVDKLAFLPVTIAYPSGVKLTLLESDLEAYPGMFVKADSVSCSLKGVFAGYPKTTDYYPWRKQLYVAEREDFIAKVAAKRDFPWRVMAITDDDRLMPVNNLVEALASPSRVDDTSWIRPGKVAWDWWNDWGLRGVPFKAGINMDTYRHYIDFASANGIEYVVLDEGWYDPKGGDMLTTIPEIDLPELVAYGKKRGVDLVLWTVFNVLDDQLEQACEKYSEMGIAGFKVDFLDRDDQTAVEMVYRIADAAARHRLFLDYHGIYKPTGITRTYPNVLNFESVFGMEEVKWTDRNNNMPLYDVTFPYIRMMAGPVDYTPGATRNASRADWQPVYYNPMSMGTRAHQLACYIVHDSPFTMLADSPSNYAKEPEMVDFIASLPTVFDQTLITDGKMGEYIVTARRKGNHWYLGGLTDWNPRELTLDFSFLPAGEKFKALVMTDGVNADKEADDWASSEITVDSSTRLPVRLASGGGFAIRLDPVPATAAYTVTPPPAEKRGFIDPFYEKYVETDGLYVVSSGRVSDEALQKACEIIDHMLHKRPDIKRHMAYRGAHVLVIGKDEQTCDIPEYKWVCTSDPDSIAYINWRARGFGGAPEDELSSGCGEENLLALPGDKYTGENILIHEFAHLVHMLGIAEVEPDFNDRLERLFRKAGEKGLWRGTYAMSNKEEYFAEAVQSFFDCNRHAWPEDDDAVHNHVNRRAKLRAYDPEMYALLTEYFNEGGIPIHNEIHR